MSVPATTKAAPSNLGREWYHNDVRGEKVQVASQKTDDGFILGSYTTSYGAGPSYENLNITVEGFSNYYVKYCRTERTTPSWMVPATTSELDYPTPDQSDKYLHIPSNQDLHRKILINLRMEAIQPTLLSALGQSVSEDTLKITKMHILLVYDFRTNKDDLSDFTDLVWHIGQIQYFNENPESWEPLERRGQVIFDLKNPPRHHDGAYFNWQEIQFDVTTEKGEYFNPLTGEFYLGMRGRKHSYEHSFYFEIDYVQVTYDFTYKSSELPTSPKEPATVTVTVTTGATTDLPEFLPKFKVFLVFMALFSTIMVHFRVLRQRREVDK